MKIDDEKYKKYVNFFGNLHKDLGIKLDAKQGDNTLELRYSRFSDSQRGLAVLLDSDYLRLVENWKLTNFQNGGYMKDVVEKFEFLYDTN